MTICASKHSLRFLKCQAQGNDFVMVDGGVWHESGDAMVEEVKWICDRHRGVGADCVLLMYLPIVDTKDTTQLDASCQDFAMRIINCDGSEVETCGNGIQCAMLYYALLHASRDQAPEVGAWRSLRVGPPGRQKFVQMQLLQLPVPATFGCKARVTVDMGKPILGPPQAIPTTLQATNETHRCVIGAPLKAEAEHWEVTCISMENPHCVIFSEHLEDIDLGKVGPTLETHEAFPARINVHFVRVMSRARLAVRQWERGVGATLACGTGVCAALVAGVLNGVCDRQVTVSCLGGEMDVEWREDDGHCLLTGTPAFVFEGSLQRH